MKKKLIISLFVLVMCFCLVGCGDNEGSGGGSNNDRGVAKKFDGNYQYNPPKDNYYVETKDIKRDEITITARIGKQFTLYEKGESTNNMYHANEDTKKIYTLYEGKWYIDGYSDYSEYEESEESIEPFGAMEEYFMKYFKAFGYENSKLSEYYIGNEKVAGIDCWVFDSKGLNAVQMKFWINPANGTALKYINKESGAGYEVVKMNLNYTSWTDNLVPTSYEGIEGL